MNLRPKRGWLTRALLALALIALVLVWVGPASIWQTVRDGQPRLILLSLFFTPIVIAMKTFRWRLLVRTRSEISFWAALQSYLAGLTLATLTPLAAGEVGRSLFVRSEDCADLTGKVILDKLVDLSTVGLFASVGLVLTGNRTVQSVGVIVLAAELLAWGMILFLLPHAPSLLNLTTKWWAVRLRIPAIVNGLASVPYARMALNLILSLVGFTFFYCQAFILLRAFWAESPWAAVPYFPIITLSTILPIAIGGVGIREWTAVLLLRQFGISESVAFSAFFLHFVIVQMLPALAGAVVIGSFRRRAAHKTVMAQQEDVVKFREEKPRR